MAIILRASQKPTSHEGLDGKPMEHAVTEILISGKELETMEKYGYPWRFTKNLQVLSENSRNTRLVFWPYGAMRNRRSNEAGNSSIVPRNRMEPNES